MEPTTKAVRQAHILSALSRRAVHSQTELAELLAGEGVEVARATLSRDLAEIGAVRLRTEDGSLIYIVPGDGERNWRTQTGTAEKFDARLVHMAREFLVSAESSSNLVLVRTPAGAAQYLAWAIDHAHWPSVLGTVAGDDSILVISREPQGGEALAAQLLRLAKQGGQDPQPPSSLGAM